MYKLHPDDKWGVKLYWVGDPECENPTPAEKKLIDRRYELDIIGGVVDETLSYEYNEFALVLLDSEYYLLETSGCSCPSPTETWRVVHGPTTIGGIRQSVVAGDYQGYTLPDHLEEDFLKQIDAEIKRTRQ